MTWLSPWCAEHLGDVPARGAVRAAVDLGGVRAAAGRRAGGRREGQRADDGRAAACVDAQATLAERGFPCARPITPVTVIDGLAVHAEESRPGGDVLGTRRDVAVQYAEVFAWLMRELAGLDLRAAAQPALGAVGPHGSRALAGDPLARRTRPECGARLRRRDRERVRKRLLAADSAVRARPRRLRGAEPPLARTARSGPCTTGTAWPGSRRRPWRARRAARSPAPRRRRWPRSRAPPLSWTAYQDLRGRRFTDGGQEVAWAASLWPAAHNARWEALHGDPPVPVRPSETRQPNASAARAPDRPCTTRVRARLTVARHVEETALAGRVRRPRGQHPHRDRRRRGHEDLLRRPDARQRQRGRDVADRAVEVPRQGRRDHAVPRRHRAAAPRPDLERRAGRPRLRERGRPGDDRRLRRPAPARSCRATRKRVSTCPATTSRSRTCRSASRPTPGAAPGPASRSAGTTTRCCRTSSPAPARVSTSRRPPTAPRSPRTTSSTTTT